MKNITLAVEDEVLAEARRYAAANNTTVNALVRDYLTRLAAQEDSAANARKKLAELARNSTWDPGPDWKWNREALYDRGLRSGHEHPALRGFQEPCAPFKEDKSD
jgi:hypothetical protein